MSNKIQKSQEQMKESAQDENCKKHVGEENIIPKIASVIDKLEKSGTTEMTIEAQKQYKGPLPLQLLDKLDKEQCDKLIDDMIYSRERNHNNQLTFVQLLFNDQHKERFHSTLKYIFMTIVILTIFLVLLITGNIDVLKEYMPYLFAFLGGSGIVLYNVSKKQKAKPDFQDDIDN